MRYTLEKLQDRSTQLRHHISAAFVSFKRPRLIYCSTFFLAIRADRRPAGVSTLPVAPFLAAMRVAAASFFEGVLFGVAGAFFVVFLVVLFFADLDEDKPITVRNPTTPSCRKVSSVGRERNIVVGEK